MTEGAALSKNALQVIWDGSPAPGARVPAGARLVEFNCDQYALGALCWGDWDKKDAPLAVCVHGFPDEPGGYAAQAQWLAKQGYRVLAPWLPGYYRADAGADWYSSGGALTAAVGLTYLDMLEALGEDKIDLLIGHDWGAPVVYAMALATPERISRLVGAAVPYGGNLAGAFITDAEQQLRSWYMFFFQMPFAEFAVAHDNYHFIDRLWRTWSPQWSYSEEDINAVKSLFAQPQALTAALAYYRSNLAMQPLGSDRALQLQARVGQEPLPMPTLYVHGANDGCIGVDYSTLDEQMFAGGVETAVMQDAGHFMHREQSESFNNILSSWLDSH